MRRALTGLLLLSLLAGQVGMIEALLGRHYARQHMDRQVAAAAESLSTSGTSESFSSKSFNSRIQHLTLTRAERQSPNSSFVQIDDREFRYRGNLYDIVREEWRGDVWHVWVLHDREEERYLEALAQTTPQTRKASRLEGSADPDHRRPLMYRPIALAPPALASPPSPRLRAQSFPRVSFTAPQAPHLEVPHPPPWG